MISESPYITKPLRAAQRIQTRRLSGWRSQTLSVLTAKLKVVVGEIMINTLQLNLINQ